MKRAPVGIGIVGTGFARSTQIPGFRDCMGAKVVAIASGRRERAEAVAKEFGIEHVAADWQELVQRDDVDLVGEGVVDVLDDEVASRAAWSQKPQRTSPASGSCPCAAIGSRHAGQTSAPWASTWAPSRTIRRSSAESAPAARPRRTSGSPRSPGSGVIWNTIALARW